MYTTWISEIPEEQPRGVQIDVNTFRLFLKQYMLAKVNREIFEYLT